PQRRWRGGSGVCWREARWDLLAVAAPPPRLPKGRGSCRGQAAASLPVASFVPTSPAADPVTLLVSRISRQFTGRSRPCPTNCVGLTPEQELTPWRRRWSRSRTVSRSCGRNTGVHESRAGGDEPTGHRHKQRCLLAGVMLPPVV